MPTRTTARTAARTRPRVRAEHLGPEKRRPQILDAALDLATEHGIGALTIGALYPTNLSDIYTYLPLGFAVLTFSVWRSDVTWRRRFDLPDWAAKLLLSLGSIALFTLLTRREFGARGQRRR